ncbi:hypothetical protein FOZ63_015849, partial [Perkinsus olseni]
TYVADVETGSYIFLAVFMVKDGDGFPTVDVIYKPGSNSNEYVIDYDSGEDASPVTEMRELCPEIPVADGDFRLLKQNADGTLSTHMENRMLSMPMADSNYASVYYHRRPGVVITMIVLAYGPDRRSKRSSTVSRFGNVEPIFECRGIKLRAWTDTLDIYRDESRYPEVQYYLGDEWELEDWGPFMHEVGQVCGLNLQPHDLLYFLRTTHTTIITELEGDFIELTMAE